MHFCLIYSNQFGFTKKKEIFTLFTKHKKNLKEKILFDFEIFFLAVFLIDDCSESNQTHFFENF